MAYADEKARLERRRQMVQALIQQGGQPQGFQAGRAFVGPTTTSSLANLASILAGGVMDRRLEKKERTLDEGHRGSLLNALRGLTGDASGPAGAIENAPGVISERGATGGPQMPGMGDGAPVDPRRAAAMSVLQGLPLDQMQGIVGQQAVANLFPKPQKLERVDLGNEIGIVDEGGNIVRRFPKGVSPDSQLGASVSMRGQDIGARTTTRGQDLTSQTATRGQDVTMRGQDIGAETERAKLEAQKQKAAAEAAEVASKSAQRAQVSIAGADNVISEVDKAFDQVRWSTTGLVGSGVKQVPGSDARNLSATLQTIKANIGFDRLQQMREVSPTGGALGQVAVQELDALQASIASLDQSQGSDQLRANLGKVRQHYENWKQAVMLANNLGQQDTAAPATGEWAEVESLMQRFLPEQ